MSCLCKNKGAPPKFSPSDILLWHHRRVFQCFRVRWQGIQFHVQKLSRRHAGWFYSKVLFCLFCNNFLQDWGSLVLVKLFYCSILLFTILSKQLNYCSKFVKTVKILYWVLHWEVQNNWQNILQLYYQLSCQTYGLALSMIYII